MKFFKGKKFKNFSKKVNKGLKSIKKFVKENKLFFIVVFINVFNEIMLRTITSNSVKVFFAIQPVLADIFIVTFLLSFSFFFERTSSRNIYLLIMTYIFATICIINSSYYSFYSSYASISQLSTTRYLGEVKSSLNEIVKVIDFVYLIMPIILTIYLIVDKKVVEKKNNRSFKDFLRVNAFSLIVLLLFISTLRGVDYSRFAKQWNRIYVVDKFGLYVYHLNDTFQSLEPKFASLFGYDKAKKEFDEYFENKKDFQNYTNEYTNIFKDKSIIAIHGESIQNFLIGMKINGKEVTPNLNRLTSEGLYFNNFYAHVSIGTSADTEFTLNTGLMPAQVGVAFVSYSNRKFNSIPKYLSNMGYRTLSFHGNHGDFWNRFSMYKSIGYDKFYDKSAYDVDETIGLGISDKSFFSQTVDILKEEKKEHDKIYATVIMLTNHTPFFDVDPYTENPLDIKLYRKEKADNGKIVNKEYPFLEGTLLGRYLKSAHYADEAIGEFIKKLDKEGLLEDTVIMFYGDHDARLPKKEYLRYLNYDYNKDDILDRHDSKYRDINDYEYELNRKVPFFFWEKNRKHQKKVDYPMATYNIMPTLGNMMGFYNKYAIGEDIFKIKDKNIVIFPNGNYLTNNFYYNSQAEEQYILKDTVLPENYIKEKADESSNKLKLSNNILNYDLLRNKDKSKKNESKVIEEIINEQK